MTRSKPERRFKILFIGDSSVGKTSLMIRFTIFFEEMTYDAIVFAQIPDDKFTETFTSTIGLDFTTKIISVRGEDVQLQLWDTAGQEKFFNMTRSYYRSADAIVLVYDRTEASSFQHIARWMRNIDENAPEYVIRVLIANKSDLHHRVVISTENGKQLADKFGVDFFETSAKSDSNENILKIFCSITEKILDQNQPIIKPPIIKLKESDNLLDSSYGKLIGCCSSATTIEK